ncbi:hypothetical protein MNV49_006240 [Pseudohyphozyma bogoriensis]|nr:hypothetical protein MNV49_006240 [Pseudohyphozyma bogoriensis]
MTNVNAQSDSTPTISLPSEPQPAADSFDEKKPVRVPHRGTSLKVPTETTGHGSNPGFRASGSLAHAESGESLAIRRSASPAGSAVSAASMAPPENFHDVAQVYQIVCSRRATFDNLLWSVPSTSFAAQAFLFQTALAGDTAQSARIISMALSILITILTLQLFTRQLQG